MSTTQLYAETWQEGHTLREFVKGYYDGLPHKEIIECQNSTGF